MSHLKNWDEFAVGVGCGGTLEDGPG